MYLKTFDGVDVSGDVCQEHIICETHPLLISNICARNRSSRSHFPGIYCEWEKPKVRPKNGI